MRWRLSFKDDSNNEITADRWSEINFINKIFRQDAREIVRRAQAKRPGARFPVHKSAEGFSQMRVALQVTTECLSNFSAANDQDVLIANATFNSLKVVALHHIAETENAGQTEERQCWQRSAAGQLFSGDENNHDGDHG